MNEVVPFGKYKGKPIEALKEDKSYTDWLTTQDWFIERYQSMYTIIVNNFSEPSETPAHNELQGRFIDKAKVVICISEFLKVKQDDRYYYKTTVWYVLGCFVKNARCGIMLKKNVPVEHTMLRLSG